VFATLGRRSIDSRPGFLRGGDYDGMMARYAVAGAEVGQRWSGWAVARGCGGGGFGKRAVAPLALPSGTGSWERKAHMALIGVRWGLEAWLLVHSG
jgi:hypothetical protein